MPQSLSHKGLSGTCRFDEKLGFYCGRLDNVQGVVAFRGDTVEEAQEDFINAVNGYLEGFPGRMPDVSPADSSNKLRRP